MTTIPTNFKRLMAATIVSASLLAAAPDARAATTGGTGNIAYLRPVRTSSCFDYNLTGQLLTDGIIADAMPPSLAVSTNSGLLPRREREWAIDGGEWSRNTLTGASNFLQYEWTGMTVEADRIDLRCNVAYKEAELKGGYSIRLLVPDKKGGSTTWRTVAETKGDGLPGKPSPYKMSSDPNKQTANDFLPARAIQISLALPKECRKLHALRVEFSMEGAVYWSVFDICPYRGKEQARTQMLPNSRFGSAWMSQGEGRQWAQVDLGAESTVEAVRLNWIRRPRKGHIEVSDDAHEWRHVADLRADRPQRNERIAIPGTTARYVRVVMDGGSTDVARTGHVPASAYILSELEVEGMPGSYRDYIPHMSRYADGRLSLNTGDWMLCRSSEVGAGGEKIASAKYRTGAQWIPAKVPATVLTSFVDYGVLDDPNKADNIFNISDSYFNSDFWYRRTFSVPEEMRGQRIVLNFDGINWKADVWLNGKRIDRIEGAFCRSHVDITPYINANGTNTLAVLIHKTAHPGAVKEKNRKNTDFNGGALGADNPTFHATAGWDWISTIRGRDIGIWNDVYLTATHDIMLYNPLVATRLANLPDTTATLTPRVVAENMLDSDISGTLQGWIGDTRFSRQITLAAKERREIVFEPEDFPTLRNRRMRLWWPNGMGEPYLYDAGFDFTPASGKSQQTAALAYRTGIRQMTYSDTATQLKLFVNGRRLIPLGGNWGMPEANLRYGEHEYDTAVRLHRDMHLNMIRNWVGMTGDEEFYDACDRYGIMVWQDFWLANPADGPDPTDEPMFMRNARDFTARMRRHPAIALYCGRNEGYPPRTLDEGLRQTVGQMNPGMLYISSSADDGVSGHGPYWAEPARTYFAKQTGKLHTERGMPNIMTWESTERTLAQPTEWPTADAWGQHDFTQEGAQRGASFMKIMERMFGKITSPEQFTRLAQWENYEGYRAMYEADSKYRQGLLIWMSHPCWPSFTWQCYDYYFEPTAAFFATRKACEPLHIQWNALTRTVEVQNRCAGDRHGLTATRDILDVNGNTVKSDRAVLDSPDDSTIELDALRNDSLPDGLDGTVYYLRLRLADNTDNTLSDNFYVLSTDDGNLQQLNSLPEVNLTAATEREDDSSLMLTLRNESATPAMMIRLCLKADDGMRVLPVDYTDNYFHLMPGEERTVRVKWNRDDTRRQTPFIELTGFNVKQRTLR